MLAHEIMLRALAERVSFADVGFGPVRCYLSYAAGRVTNGTEIRLPVPAKRSVERVVFLDAAGTVVHTITVDEEKFPRDGFVVIPALALSILIEETA